MTTTLVDPLAGLECPPQWYWVPAHVASYGPEVADFAGQVGLHLDAEQRLVLDAMYAVDEDDRLVAPEVGCSAPRQNVKTHVAKAAALADLAVFEVPECFWTAQQKDTARDAFRNKFGTGLADLFDNYDALRRRVDTITDSDNETSIVLRRKRAGDPQPSLTFATRTERGKVGYSGRRVTFDEAPWLKPVHTAAMVPTLSAQSMAGWVQLRYLGSPGRLHSYAWRDVRNRGRSRSARALAWIEWGLERLPCVAGDDCVHARGVEGCALERDDLLRSVNLSIGRRMDIRFLRETERDSMDVGDWIRERWGVWEDPPEGGGVLDLNVWRLRATRSEPMVRPTLAVEVAKDRSSAMIGAAWWVDGVAHLEIVDDKPGTDWVPARAAELAGRYGQGAKTVVVVDPATEAGELVAALEAHRSLSVVKVTPAERVAACGRWFDLASRPGLTHNGDPAFEDAIKTAAWRDVGDDSRVLSRKNSGGDIRALYVGVLSLRGLEHGGAVVLEGSLGV